MSGSAYSYLDLTVLDGVREHLISDSAAILFTGGLSDIVWCNAQGVSLIGADNVRHAIEGDVHINPAMRRQLASAVARLRAGDGPVKVLVRLQRHFTSDLVGISLQTFVLPDGDHGVLLLSGPESSATTSFEEQARLLVNNLDGKGHSSALVSDDGAIIVSSASFRQFSLGADVLRDLCETAACDESRLVKKVVASAKGPVPAGIARICDEPCRSLLIVAGTDEDEADEAEGRFLPETRRDGASGASVPALSSWYYSAGPVAEPSAMPVQETGNAETVQDDTDRSFAKPALVAGVVATGAAVVAAVGASLKSLKETADGSNIDGDELRSGQATGDGVDPSFEARPDTPSGTAKGLAGGISEPREDRTDDTEENAQPVGEDGESLFPAFGNEDTAPTSKRHAGKQEPGAGVAPVDIPAPLDGPVEHDIVPPENLLVPAPEDAGAVQEPAGPVDLAKPVDDTGSKATEKPLTGADRPSTARSGDHAVSATVPDMPATTSIRRPRSSSQRGTKQRRRKVEVMEPLDLDEETFESPPFSFQASRKAQRFAWQADADKHIVTVGPELAAALGTDPHTLIGHTWADAAHALRLDGAADINTLLDSHDTWSGRTVMWPSADGSVIVPVDLAGLPTYSSNRDFTGYSGFGIIRMADAVSHMETDLPQSSKGAAGEPITVVTGSDEAEPDGLGPETARKLSARDQKVFAEIGNHLSETPVELAASSIDRPQAPGAGNDEDVAEHQDRVSDDNVSDDGFDASEPEEEDARPDGGVDPLESPADPSFNPPTDADSAEGESADGDTAQEGERGEDMAVGFKTGQDERDSVGSIINADLVSEDLHDGHIRQVVDPAMLDGDNEQGVSGLEGQSAPAGYDHAAPSNVSEQDAPAKPAVPEHNVDTSILARLPIPLLVYRDLELLFANADFYNLTGYQSLQDFADAGGVERLFGAYDDAQRDGPGAPIYHRNGELLDVQAHLQHVPWDAARAMLLTLRPGNGPDGRRDKPEPHLPNDAGNIVTFAPPDSDSRKGDAEPFGGVSAEDLRAVLDTASDGILFLSAKGTIQGASRSAEALLDRPSTDLEGKALADYLAPESRDKFADYLAGISGGGVERLLNDGREFMLRTPDGGLIPVFMTIGRMGDSDKLCAVMRDVTAWRRTEEELLKAKNEAETANEQKTGFLARVSHEIRTPLNAIIGFSDLMLEERFGRIENDRYRGYLLDIHRSGTHVLDLVNDLLDISKIEAGKINLTFDACDLNLLVSNCVATMQAQANTNRIIIRSSLSAVVPKVVADQRSLKQIILNLVSNSIKFTRAGGQVIVSTVYDQSGEVALRVRDTGIGMSRADLERAMEPFQQVETVPSRIPARKNEQRGTGLGLPLTRAMALANKATFDIESELEEGTLVEIRFPANRVLRDS